MVYEVKTIEWTPLPTSKSGSGFYPATKFIGQVYADGKLVHETGKCAKRANAFNAASAAYKRIREENQRLEMLRSVDNLFAGSN